MTSNECALFKVFLKTDDTTEIKKFVIDDSTVITSFIFMKEKLQTLFPKLREASFKITWRDSEGDDVIIDNDDDLILAFTEMEDSLKTLYVTIVPHSSQQFNPPQYTCPPSRIVCDSCNNEITTYRYKCIQCYDYDLCGNCEHAGHHAHHMMLRTSTPELPLARCGRKIFEQVNKAVKKANHIAYKECKRRTKWDKKKCDGNEAGGEESCKKDASTPGCPFEEYVPQFFPIIDAISNAASAAANAAAQAATNAGASTGEAGNQPNASAQAKGSTSEQANRTHDMNYPTSQFMEVIRNALSGVFVQQPHSQGTAQPTPSPTQSQPNQATATPNAPKAPEDHIDLTVPVEPMDTSMSQREPGWTLLPTEESQLQYPVLNPIVTPQQPVHQQQQSQPQIPVFNSAPTQQPPQQSPQQLPQQPPQQVQYPVLNMPTFLAAQHQDPHIAQGLSQLLEMGFSDEQALISLLKRFNGNVDNVIKYIFENK